MELISVKTNGAYNRGGPPTAVQWPEDLIGQGAYTFRLKRREALTNPPTNKRNPNQKKTKTSESERRTLDMNNQTKQKKQQQRRAPHKRTKLATPSTGR